VDETIIPCDYINISVLNTDLFEDFYTKNISAYFKRFLLFFLHKILFFEKVLKEKFNMVKII
jgi:hypothetical protein